MACRTQEAIGLAQDAINKVHAHCPKVAAAAPAPAPTPLPKVMLFDSAAMFEFDKSDLKQQGKEMMLAYREQARAELSRADKIKISGHTDNVGAADYNMKLSLRRAKAVRDYLVSLGADAKKMEVTGEGMSRPIADNGTPEGRAKNRRVEVEVIGVGK